MKRKSRPPVYDITGEKYGYLEVVRMEQTPRSKRGSYFAICKCHNCGKDNYEVIPANLKRGSTTSCGCRRDFYQKITGENSSQFTGYKEIRGGKWRKIKEGAARRNFDFEIAIEDAWVLFERQKRKCIISGLPIKFGRANKNAETTASLDRIDITKGYVPGNVQWVHKRINIMRNTLSVPEFISFCKIVADNNK